MENNINDKGFTTWLDEALAKMGYALNGEQRAIGSYSGREA